MQTQNRGCDHHFLKLPHDFDILSVNTNYMMFFLFLFFLINHTLESSLKTQELT